jgi:hypothetical protein
MGRAVLLLHEEPGGEIHYDWMIEGGASEGLVTFRVAERIDSGGDGEFAAKRIGEHRREYLDFEGELSGGRGGVTRVARGELVIEIDQKGRFRARGQLGERVGLFEGAAEGRERWRFSFAAAEK